MLVSSVSFSGLAGELLKVRTSRVRAGWPGTGCAGQYQSWPMPTATPFLVVVVLVYRTSPVAALNAVSMALPSDAAEGSAPDAAGSGRWPPAPGEAPPASSATTSPATAAAVARPVTRCGQRGDRAGRAALTQPGQRRPAPGLRCPAPSRTTVSALGAWRSSATSAARRSSSVRISVPP